MINRILIKLGLRKPEWKCQILVPQGPRLTEEQMKKFDGIGWKFYNSHGIISTGNVDVERSKEHEQT